ncbi:MAG: hypothetical protein QM769_06100 [Pseudoxanthomonas sp.]
MKTGFRLIALLLLALMVAAPADAAGKRKRANQLEQSRNALAASIRWGEFEKAWELVEPAYREAHPLTELVLERYRQVQITGYSDLGLGGTGADGTITRAIELRVVNRHTMAERSLRYEERWRWDEAARRWWLVGGLPDLWNGE